MKLPDIMAARAVTPCYSVIDHVDLLHNVWPAPSGRSVLIIYTSIETLGFYRSQSKQFGLLESEL